MFHVPPGTLVIYGDIACPWATLAVVRRWKARARLGLDDSVRFDLRAFPLELAKCKQRIGSSATASRARRAGDTG